MAKQKVYAIKNGIDPKTKEPVTNLILEDTWDEVEKYTKGVSGAIFEGFITKQEAEDFLNDNTDSFDSKEDNALYCYVDGSFNKNIPNYGYGLVCVQNANVIFTDRGPGTNKSAITMYQIGGELLGAMKALIFAKNNNYSKVYICHDYFGVAHHATGRWKRNNKFSEDYYKWMQKFFKTYPDIKVSFKKVKSHSGNKFNELADGLAKLAVNIKPDTTFYEYADKYAVSH